jgi:tripartite-type tricarboxylate transporter receptor subunit TctC
MESRRPALNARDVPGRDLRTLLAGDFVCGRQPALSRHVGPVRVQAAHGQPQEVAMKLIRRRFIQLAAAAAALPSTLHVAAQGYPAQPIRLVIPFPPGGAFDAVGRPMAERMRPLLGTVVVENIGGGGSSLGAAAVARARSDGYTLLLGGTQTHVNEALLKTRPLYDPLKDLEPIAAVAANVLCVAVHPSVPAATLADLVAYAKANPGKLSYGHSGVGSIQHLAGELFKARAGTPDIVPVPYRGTGPVITDLIRGQLPVGTPGVTGQVIELHRTGRLRVLAVTGSARLGAAPELPTAAEQGFPDLVVVGSIGLFAPAGTPDTIIARVAEVTRIIVSDPTYRQPLVNAGIEPALEPTPEKFRQALSADLALWAPLVSALGLKVD